MLDPEGNILVHPDPALAGKNGLDLTDLNGKPVIRGLIDAAMTLPHNPEGWHHYQWPVSRTLLPRWKSSYVQLVTHLPSTATLSGAACTMAHGERLCHACGGRRRLIDRETLRGGLAAVP